MSNFSISELTTFRWTFEDDVHEYRRAGVSALSVWRHKLSDFGEGRGIELLAESGMAVSSLFWAGGFTGNDGRTYRESVEDARDALQLARELRAPCLIVHSGTRNGHTRNHARRLLKSALGELLPLADEFGVTLALEPMHHDCAGEFTFLTDLDDAREFLSDIGSDRVKMVFDTFHFGQSERVLERLGDLVDHIAVVHLADVMGRPTAEQNRCRLGNGSVPLEPILRTLRQTGYDGYYELELMGEEIESSDYVELLEHSRDMFAKLVD